MNECMNELLKFASKWKITINRRICTEIFIENDNSTFHSRTVYDSIQIQFKTRILAHVCFADAARLVYSIDLLYCHQFDSIELKIIIDRFLVSSIFFFACSGIVYLFIFFQVFWITAFKYRLISMNLVKINRVFIKPIMRLVDQKHDYWLSVWRWFRLIWAIRQEENFHHHHHRQWYHHTITITIL